MRPAVGGISSQLADPNPGEAPQPNDAPAATTPQTKKARKPKETRRNEPTVDLATELKRIGGVDLTSIDGIDVITAQTILSEIGTI